MESSSAESEPDPDVLEDIVRRVVKVAAPQKIILFGSAARGQMGPNSDIDLLVVKSDDYHRGALTDEIYMSLFGVGGSRGCGRSHSRRRRALWAVPLRRVSPRAT